MSRKHRFINKKTRSSTYKFETILCVDRGIFFYRIIELSGIIVICKIAFSFSFSFIIFLLASFVILILLLLFIFLFLSFSSPLMSRHHILLFIVSFLFINSSSFLFPFSPLQKRV